MYLLTVTLLLLLLLLLLVGGSSLQNEVPIEANDRIFNGKIAPPNSAPYQAAMFVTNRKGYRNFCGGSLLTTTFVLTAAHCVLSVKSISITFGSQTTVKKERDAANAITVQVKGVQNHERYNEETDENDIALLELAQPVKLSKFIETVKLPKKSEFKNSFVGKYGRLTGFGRISDKIPGPNEVLKELRVLLVPQNNCAAYKINEKQICGYGDAKGSPCLGDSGGPLLLENSNTQIGVVSFGSGEGCSRGYTHVYTNVYWYLDWIERNSNYKF